MNCITARRTLGNIGMHIWEGGGGGGRGGTDTKQGEAGTILVGEGTSKMNLKPLMSYYHLALPHMISKQQDSRSIKEIIY